MDRRLRRGPVTAQWTIGIAMACAGVWITLSGGVGVGVVLVLAGALSLPIVHSMVERVPVARREADPFMRQLRQEGLLIGLGSVGALALAILAAMGVVTSGSPALAVGGLLAGAAVGGWLSYKCLTDPPEKVRKKLSGSDK